MFSAVVLIGMSATGLGCHTPTCYPSAQYPTPPSKALPCPQAPSKVCPPPPCKTLPCPQVPPKVCPAPQTWPAPQAPIKAAPQHY